MTLEEPESEGSSRVTEKAKEEPIEDDDLYCLQSTFVYFQVCRFLLLMNNHNTDKFVSSKVERCIFHIPTYRFVNESLFFKGMFNLPQPNVGDSNVEGSSRENPILLPDNISRNDFRNFLMALYPL